MIPLPIDGSDLPSGWHIFFDGKVLGMLGATVCLLRAPDPNYRLRGAEWEFSFGWIPRGEEVAPGVKVYEDYGSAIVEGCGVGFWSALYSAIQESAPLPDTLREKLLREIRPWAEKERQSC